MDEETGTSLGIEQVGERAYELVREFAVRVGPRKAGGLNERSALEYAQSVLRPVCTAVTRQPIDGIPDLSPTRLSYTLVLAGLLWAAWQTRSWPWAAPLYLFVFFVIPTLYGVLRGQPEGNTPQRTSFNLIGDQGGDRAKAPTLMVCAHIDSARVALLPGDTWAWLHRRLQSSWLPFTVLLCLLGFARLVDSNFALLPAVFWDVAWLLPLAIAVLFVSYELFYFVISRSPEHSPGANDNASGAAAVLALAEYFHRHPPEAINLRYALFTAKEAGLLGSRRYVRENRQDALRTSAIVLDTVGSGTTLRYVRQLGLFPPRRTSRLLNSLLRATSPGIEAHWWLFGDTDLYPLLKRGIAATSLETYGDPWRDRVRHTGRDDIQYISPEALRLTTTAVVRAVELLDHRQALVPRGV